MHFGALQCDWAKPVAVGVITTVSAEGEIISQSEMPHFDARALRRVAGEQAKCGAFTCSQMIQQWKNTIDHAPCKFTTREIFCKKLMVNGKVVCKPFIGELHAIMTVNATNDAKVGRASEVELGTIVTKDLTRRLFQCRHAGAAGVDERAINVEQVKHRRHARKTTSGLSLARLLELFFSGVFTFGCFVWHFVVEVLVRCIILVVIVLFHQLAVEEMELALALMRGQR